MFDSGIGGLSVLSEIRSHLPQADLLYVADRARAPYGRRSLEEVRVMSHEIARWLIDQGATTLVVACNTASAASLHSLRGAFADVAIVGMEPAVKPAAEMTLTGKIAVFATSATFQGELFESVVRLHAGSAEVIERACPEWVDLVESGRISGPEVEAAVLARVGPVLEQGADTLVLGCTHFSFLREVIEAVAGSGVTVVDPAPAVAAQVKRVAPEPGSGASLRIAGSGDLNALERLVGWVARIQPDFPLLAFPS